MKDLLEEIVETCEKIKKISELRENYPENVVAKLKEEFKLKLKELASKIEIDFSFLSEELERIERDIELIKRDFQDLENSLKGLEIRYLIGELKEGEKEKKAKIIQKEMEKLKGKESSLLSEKERIERIIKRGYEVAKEESKIFKVPLEEIPTPKGLEEEKPVLQLEEREEIEKQEEKETPFEFPSFSFEGKEEEKLEINKPEEESKIPEQVEEIRETKADFVEEKQEFSPLETIGFVPEKDEKKEEIIEEGKTAYIPVPYIIIKTPSGERRFLLSEGKNTFGRSPDCSIVINEKGVSREHFAIHVKGETFTIEDLNSKNGTFLNGKKIRSAELKNGDEIIAGECSLIFEFS